MLQVMLAVEIVIALALVGTILLQQSEGGALGMGGGSGGGGGGFGGFMSARGAANLLTRATSFLAFAFIGVALFLAVISGQRTDGTSVFDDPSDLATPFSQEELSDDLGAPITLDDDLPSLDEPPAEDGDEGGGGE
ncbi:MAG: preprotein translocase subunit SecG [Alphaproteobacteria bacterium]